MSKPLLPNDHCSSKSPTGLKLRYIVQDYMPMKTRGEEILVPVMRDINHKTAHCHLDGSRERKRRVLWKKRSELRKLPSK